MMLSGLDQLQAIKDGRSPAPSGLTHFPTEIVSLERGSVTLRATPPKAFANPKGDVHGGFVTVLLLNCLATTVQSCMAPDQGFITLEMKVNFGKPVRPDSELLRADGELIHLGRKTAIASAEVRDVSGKMIGVANATFLLTK